MLKIEPGGGAACQVQSVHDKFLASDLTIFTTQIILTPIFVLISTEPSFANHCSLVFRLSQRLCKGRILTALILTNFGIPRVMTRCRDFLAWRFDGSALQMGWRSWRCKALCVPQRRQVQGSLKVVEIC